MHGSEHRSVGGIWHSAFRVHSYEVDASARATLVTLCRYFQEAAWNHAELLGVGYEALRSKGKFWALSRLLIRIKQYPFWNDTVELRTWPRTANGLLAMRDFQMLDPEGRLLGAGGSGWLVLDAAARKPVRLERVLPPFTCVDQRALPEDPEKLPLPTTSATVPGPVVAYSDLDVNGHVNNTRYLTWVLDSYDMGFHQSNYVEQFEAAFLGEAKVGEGLGIRTQQLGPVEFIHSLMNPGGTELFRARLRWRQQVSTSS